MEDKVISPEKAEEAKLKARYPHLGQKPGGSDFLRKRLQKGVSSLLSQGMDKKFQNSYIYDFLNYFLLLLFHSTGLCVSRRVLRNLNFVKAQEEVCFHKTHTRLAGWLFTAPMAPLNFLERIKLRNRLSAAVIDFTKSWQ